MGTHRYRRALTPRELMIVGTIADGWQIKQVAAAFGIKVESVKSAVKNARCKYRAAGRDAGTIILLGQRLREDGYPF